MYTVISIFNTRKDEKFFTLWKNGGYTFFLKEAGRYTEIKDGYHNSERNIPIDQEMLDKLEKVKILNGFGEPFTGIANNNKNRKILGVKYVNNTLCKN